MSATSIVSITDNSASTATRITDSRILVVVRVLWTLLLAFELVVIGLLLPISHTASYENDPRYSAEAIAPLREAGLLHESWLLNKAMGVFNAVICVVLSSMLMWGTRNECVALLFAFILLGLATSVMPEPYNSIPFALAAFQSFLFNVAIFTVIYLFPDGRFVPKWSRYILGGIIIGLMINHWTAEDLNNRFVLPFVVVMFFGIGAMVYRYRLAPQRQRQQMKWLVSIFIFYPPVFIVWIISYLTLEDAFAVVQLFLGLIGSLLIAAIPLAVGLAVLRYGLWSVDLVINRSLVYGVVTVLLVIVFALSAFGIQSVLGAENTLAAFVVSAIPPLLLFNPTRKRVQNLVDRYIYRLNFNLNELAAAQKPFVIHNPGALTGKNLNGFEVYERLGKGGMGEIYKGVGNGQTVAIKTMLPEIAADADMRSRFQREAQAGMRLNHPHIARVHAQGETDGTPYLVMDYIEGQDLSQRLKTEGRLDEETATRLMQDICAALEVAHHQGFVHRDLKPSNVMIRPNGQAVLMDFGITKMTTASTSLTGTGAIGTIDYMAPEQIMSAKEVDKRADIYALGVMLYEMLTGEKPFKGSAAQILFAHLQQPVPDAQTINPEIPDALAEAIERAMSKNPNDRFPTAVDLAAALKA